MTLSPGENRPPRSRSLIVVSAQPFLSSIFKTAYRSSFVSFSSENHLFPFVTTASHSNWITSKTEYKRIHETYSFRRARARWNRYSIPFHHRIYRLVLQWQDTSLHSNLHPWGSDKDVHENCDTQHCIKIIELPIRFLSICKTHSKIFWSSGFIKRGPREFQQKIHDQKVATTTTCFCCAVK